MAGRKPTGIVIGDALGIGPEITVKALADPFLYRACQPILIGDPEIVKRALKKSKVKMDVRIVASPGEATIRYPALNLIPIPFPELYPLPMGKLSPLSGKAFVAWFRKGYELAETGQVGAMVYAPLNKESVYGAGYPFHDEVDMIKNFHKGNPFLLVVSMAGRYRFASVPPLHISLRQACEDLSVDAVFRLPPSPE